MRKYSLTTNEDAIQRNPYWIAIVFPFRWHQTYDSRTVKAINIMNPAETFSPVILTSDISGFQFSGSASSPTESLSLNLNAGFSETLEFNETSDRLGAEDWIVFWALDNYTDYAFIKNNLANPRQAALNDFKIAPKFVGQISSIFKAESVDSIGGINLTYEMVCYSFNHFMSRQYFDQTLDLLGPEASRWWSRFSEFESFSQSTQGGLIPIQEAIWRLLLITLGFGPADFPADLGPRAVSPNQKYIVPKALGELLTGKVFTTDPTILDISYYWLGVQKYSGGENDSFRTFLPSSLNTTPIKGTATFFESAAPLIGQAIVKPLNFNGTSVFEILGEYTVQPINESINCLKPQADGRVQLTSVFRQNVKSLIKSDNAIISTDLFDPSEFDPVSASTPAPEPTTLPFPSTYFGEVPRWEISSKLIYNLRVGISGSSRINYVQITPVNWLKNEQSRNELNASLALPIVDSTDIFRNGLQMINQVIPIVWANDSTTDLENQNGFFNKIMASITFNSHLKLSGTAELEGVQLPIQKGDACTIDGVTYFIERVQHSGQISPSGQKMFRTTLVLTDGVVFDANNNVSFPKLSITRHNVVKE